MSEVPITSSGKSGPLIIILANGCFDVIHSGHTEHLREARKMGDFLFVGLTRDEFVNKPGRPINTWEERAAILRELRSVTAVVACNNGAEAIRQVKPQIFVKGIDYETKGLLKDEIDACNEVGAKIVFTKSEKKSSTDIIQRIKCA
jgi:rfaE bifunctional protein nucleotidyltransferase chain/domain